MKKLLISGIFIGAFLFYILFHHSTSSALSANNITLDTSTKGRYKDGIYTGSSVDAFYGTVQVKAAVQNGKLVDIQFMRYPNEQRESVEVSQNAMPLLKQEAIQMQSANVDVVSGATQTSQAFTESLAAALTHSK